MAISRHHLLYPQVAQMLSIGVSKLLLAVQLGVESEVDEQKYKLIRG